MLRKGIYIGLCLVKRVMDWFAASPEEIQVLTPEPTERFEDYRRFGMTGQEWYAIEQAAMCEYAGSSHAAQHYREMAGYAGLTQ